MTEFELAERYLNSTHVSLFLTGKAGTGKTTFLRHFVSQTKKRCVVVAPTGVAAINAHGVTIHSFFLLPLCPYLPDVKELVTEYQMPEKTKHFNKDKIRLIRMLDVLVIDEISMVRADLLDAIDFRLRQVRRSSKPFGGVQLLMIGDLLQLPPVVTDDEKPYMDQVYPSPFFFNSKALQRLDYVTVELTHVFRQEDSHFVSLLNKIRNNQFDLSTLALLNTRFIPGFNPPDNEGYIRLTTHNYQADSVNRKKLEDLRTPSFELRATVNGSFPSHAYPTAEVLTLKPGTRVMFIKNKGDGSWYNGKLATVDRYVDGEGVWVHDDDGKNFCVGKEVWENVKYQMSDTSNEVRSVVEGTFEQYPFRLAWAITIHKSQGLTFDKVIIDAASAFSFGQVYVALSRCRTFEGIVLASKISPQCAFDNSDLVAYNEAIPSADLLEQSLLANQTAYFFQTLSELFDMSTLQRSAEQINRIYQEYLRNLFPNGAERMSHLCFGPIADLASVSERFRYQLLRLADSVAISDPFLHERIAKAQQYFSEQLQQIELSAAPLIEVEIDNKVVAKEFAKHVETFVDTIGLCLRCLSRIAVEGFSPETYNAVRSDFLFEKERNKAPSPTKKHSKEKKQPLAVSDDVKHPVLFNRLKKWRKIEADKIGKSAFVVLTQKSLLAIVQYLPRNKTELLKIPGIGPSKLQQYGDAILSIVDDYLKNVR